MINTIIFDFGDIFINLDKQATENAFRELGVTEWNPALKELNIKFETGKISRGEFLGGIQRNIENATIEQILVAWNAILLDFPRYRLEFLQLLSTKYRLFLLSNTDAIHIETFKLKNGISFYNDFYQCFEKVYFSFEIGLRKPDLEIFNHLINNHNLDPKQTLFVDDKKENTDAALTLGFKVWNLQVGQEDVIQLLEKNIL